MKMKIVVEAFMIFIQFVREISFWIKIYQSTQNEDIT